MKKLGHKLGKSERGRQMFFQYYASFFLTTFLQSSTPLYFARLEPRKWNPR